MKTLSFKVTEDERLGMERGFSKYLVCFEDFYVRKNGATLHICGKGNTIDEAIHNYCFHISNYTLVKHEGTKEIDSLRCPRLNHTRVITDDRRIKVIASNLLGNRTEIKYL